MKQTISDLIGAFMVFVAIPYILLLLTAVFGG